VERGTENSLVGKAVGALTTPHALRPGLLEVLSTLRNSWRNCSGSFEKNIF